MARQNKRRVGEVGPKVPTAKPTVEAKEPEIPKAKKRAWESDFQISVSDMLNDQAESAQARNGAPGVMVGGASERVCIGLPLKALVLQYLYSSDCYPLGRMEMLIGESDSNKTAFLFEKFRWFLREPKGGAVYELNEARDPADFRTSIVGAPLLSDGRFLLEGPCASLEHWQRNITGLLHKFENKFKQKGGCAFPLIIGLDSITGTTNEKAIKAIDEEGCAKIMFGIDANLLNLYAKYIFQRIYPWPFAFVCTNHVKFGQDKYGNKVMRIPGGDELRYVSTYITHLTKVKDIDRVSVGGGREIKIKMLKSQGDHRSATVDFVWWFDEKTGEQTSVWNWHAATIALLESFAGERRKDIQDMCLIQDYNKNSQTAKCPTLGIKKSTPLDQIGSAIMADKKVLTALQNYFGIKRRRPFELDVPYSQQIQEALKAGDTETHDSSDVAGVDKAEDESAESSAETEVKVDA